MASVQIKLICALGNPGDQYLQTRHNAGFWFFDHLSQAENFTATINQKFKALTAEFRYKTNIIRVIAPQTFMNKSGASLAPFAHYYKINVDQILVVHDEIDLPVGSVKLKTGGGHGGHNGLRDIITHLGDKKFHRLRIGVGHPGDAAKVVSYVLNRPPKSETMFIDSAINRAMNVIPDILQGNITAAMNQLNQKEP